jgi:hypothetical protein
MALILALGVATSGMNFGGLHELMASPEKLVSRLVGWNWGETGKFFGLGQESESFEAGYSVSSRLFTVCRGMFCGSGCAGRKT